MATIRIVYKDGSESVHEGFNLTINNPGDYVLKSKDDKITHIVSKVNALFVNITEE